MSISSDFLRYRPYAFLVFEYQQTDGQDGLLERPRNNIRYNDGPSGGADLRFLRQTPAYTASLYPGQIKSHIQQ